MIQRLKIINLSLILKRVTDKCFNDINDLQVFQEGFSSHYISLKEIEGDDRLKMESPVMDVTYHKEFSSIR